MSNPPDIIVVGAGSAGCAMAARLAEGGLSVLLLEAGRSNNDLRVKVPALTSALVQNPDFDWKYQANPDESINGRSDVWPGGKVLGGGSSINGMMYIRGNRWDYDHWADMGATGWRYDDLTPYFRRMETNSRGGNEWRGDSGPIGVSDQKLDLPVVTDWVDAAVAAGIKRTDDNNGENPGDGVDFVQATQRNGLRSPATDYFKLPGVREKLTIKTHIRVRRVLVENGRATGVEYDSPEGRRQQVHATHGVVVSAGAMGTPRLLMLSGIGPADHLREVGIDVVADVQAVGRNLQDHVGAHLVNDVSCATINTESRGLAAVRNGLKFLFRRRGILTTSIGHAQAFVHSREGLPAPNLQLIFGAFAFDIDERGRIVIRKQSSTFTMVCVSRPQSRGRITLRSADPEDLPVIDHQLLAVEDDMNQLIEGIEMARDIMAQSAMARHVVGEVRPGTGAHGEDLKHFARQASISLYHPCGTCRMGQGDDSVVDPDLQVHGIEGLWVADASVIPSLPSGNTNATALVIGDKGADHVLKTLAKKAG